MLKDKSGFIREFLSHSLKKRQIAFIYLGYAGIVLRVEDRVLAIDTANLLRDKEIEALSRLDLLMFTHSHADHYNRARTRKALEKTNAHVVAEAQVALDLKRFVPSERLTIASPRTAIRAGGFEIVAVEGVHPRPINIYRIAKDGFTIFHAGDSGYSQVEEYPVEMAFLPTGRPSPSCSPESALRFARDLQPKLAVAMHGTPAQLSRFKELAEKELPGTSVVIPEKFETYTADLVPRRHLRRHTIRKKEGLR